MEIKYKMPLSVKEDLINVQSKISHLWKSHTASSESFAAVEEVGEYDVDINRAKTPANVMLAETPNVT